MTKASGKIVGNDIRGRYVRAVLNLNYFLNQNPIINYRNVKQEVKAFQQKFDVLMK